MPTYFLTGANRGLGLEFVRQLSQSPSNTIIAGVRSLTGELNDLNELAKKDNVHVIECDVGSLDSISGVQSRISEILPNQGEKKINYLFNVAGINATSSDTALTIDPASLQNHMNVNVLGPAKIVETLLDDLAPDAVVLNMSSGLGSMAVATDVTKCCTYSISKAALNMLTIHMAKDLKDRATVICMDPGWVKTRMGGEGAIEEPEVSIEGMLKTVHGLKKEDSGKFYRFSGDIVPW
ncbi:NAD(P)-binding protein [Delitschia confertaspora ATCC 74209]|uniref:NAD(P)-binding protein n=1 Tax=Delitschia confertaspora ATCC 74209 TaxID=1513339 RepID=A0A9P4JQ53_9PLEO|nr:NAD(P)-binding protein [Delitschia confertaspora ATCC 74209]